MLQVKLFHSEHGSSSSPQACALRASAHPNSGIVVDQQGQVYFQDILDRAIWKIDAQGKLTKYHDKLGGGEVYVLEYTNANGGAADGWTPRVRKLARDGKVTTLATVPRRPKP